MVLSNEELFLKSRPLEKEDMMKNKYLYNAVKNNLRNYRIITSGHLAKNKWKKNVDLPEYIMNFIAEEGEVILIANIVRKTVPQIIFRSIENKRFSCLGKQNAVPYGLGYISPNFKYGDWIILVEGTSDRDALCQLYPNVLAVLTDGLSTVQLHLLEKLTNKVILMYDNDEAGSRGIRRDKNKLKKKGFDVEVIKHPNGIKDAGELLQKQFEGKFYDYEQLREYYSNWISLITGGLRNEN